MGIFGDPHQKLLKLAKDTARKMERKGKPAHEYKGEAGSIMGWHIHTLISGHYVLGSEELWMGESVVLASTGELYKYSSRRSEHSWESYGGIRTEEEESLTPYTPQSSYRGTITSALTSLPSKP